MWLKCIRKRLFHVPFRHIVHASFPERLFQIVSLATRAKTTNKSKNPHPLFTIINIELDRFYNRKKLQSF